MQQVLSCDAGRGQGATVPSQPHRQESQQPMIHFTTILYPHTVLFFTFRTVFNKLHEIVNTLLQNRLCDR